MTPSPIDTTKRPAHQWRAALTRAYKSTIPRSRQDEVCSQVQRQGETKKRPSKWALRGNQSHSAGFSNKPLFDPHVAENSKYAGKPQYCKLCTTCILHGFKDLPQLCRTPSELPRREPQVTDRSAQAASIATWGDWVKLVTSSSSDAWVLAKAWILFMPGVNLCATFASPRRGLTKQH